jgi:hypothetical protein
VRVRDHDEDREIAHEERDIYAIMVAASLPVVIGLLIEGGSMDAGATFSLALAVLGVLGLLTGLVAGARALRRPRLPRARLRQG